MAYKFACFVFPRGALTAFVLIILSAGLHAQAPSVAINSSVDRNLITIGDLIRYSVKVTRDKDLGVTLPGLAANLGQFEIRDYEVHETREYDSFDVDSIDYVITTFDTGNYVIPPLAVFIVLPDSSRDTLSTDPISIRVESVMKGDVKDIRDIKPPISIARDWTPYYLYGGLAVLLAVLAGVGIWYYRRRRTGGQVPPEKKRLRPAHETALEELDELAASSLLAEGRIKEYHVRISDIIRHYLEGRFYIAAPEMTTDQAVDAVRRTGMKEAVLGELHILLSDCDMVKFAKVIPGAEAIEESTRRAYEIVNKTKWVVEAVEAEEKRTASAESASPDAKENHQSAGHD